jgi:hypothetical protein
MILLLLQHLSHLLILSTSFPRTSLTLLSRHIRLLIRVHERTKNEASRQKDNITTSTRERLVCEYVVVGIREDRRDELHDDEYMNGARFDCTHNQPIDRIRCSLLAIPDSPCAYRWLLSRSSLPQLCLRRPRSSVCSSRLNRSFSIASGVNGVKTGPFRCSCYTGWSGSSCTVPVCTPSCGVNGRCTSPGVCTCNTGWQGASCDVSLCPLGCFNGICTGADTCMCNAGWTDATCSTRAPI